MALNALNNGGISALVGFIKELMIELLLPEKYKDQVNEVVRWTLSILGLGFLAIRYGMKWNHLQLGLCHMDRWRSFH